MQHNSGSAVSTAYIDD